MQCTCGNAEIRLTSDESVAVVICEPCGYAKMVPQVKPAEIYAFRARVRELQKE